MATNLPDWLEVKPNGDIVIYTDKVYPSLLKQLGADPQKPTRYWLEMAYQCAKLDMQMALAAAGMKPWGRRWLTHSDEKRWALEKHSDYGDRWPKDSNGKPLDQIAAARKLGAEAREHYRRIRGFVPG